MKELVEEEEAIVAAAGGGMIPDDLLAQAKKDGFSDRYLSEITGIPEEDIRGRREALGVTEKWEGVHVSGTKDSAYYYSSYNLETDLDPVNDESMPEVMHCWLDSTVCSIWRLFPEPVESVLDRSNINVLFGIMTREKPCRIRSEVIAEEFYVIPAQLCKVLSHIYETVFVSFPVNDRNNTVLQINP